VVYVPAAPTVFVPELLGDASKYGLLLDNLDGAYVDYAPPIFGPVATRFQVQDLSDQLVAEWQIRGNADAVPMYCIIRWRGTTGFTATATFEVDDGTTTDTDSVISVTSSWATAMMTVTPSTNASTRFGRLYLRVSDAAELVMCASLVTGYAPTSFPTGVLDSGCAKFDGAWANTGLPINTEVIERAHNNLRNLARDRRCGLAGGLNRFDMVGSGGPPGPTYAAAGDEFTLVERWLHPGSDIGPRPYFVGIKLAGTDPEARIKIGGYTSIVTGTGWHAATPELSLSKGMRGSIYLRSTSGGSAAMSTWQVARGVT
jgi:hypothetical protein